MSALIALLIILAVFAVLWWAVGQLALPQPFRIVAVVAIAIVAILLLLSLLNGGVPNLSGLRL